MRQIAEDALSRREAEDLNRGRAFVRNLVEQENSVLTGSVTEAVGVATAMLHGAMDVAEYIARHRPHHVRHSHTLGEEMRWAQTPHCVAFRRSRSQAG